VARVVPLLPPYSAPGGREWKAGALGAAMEVAGSVGKTSHKSDEFMGKTSSSGSMVAQELALYRRSW
jgi:hypothetical protein